MHQSVATISSPEFINLQPLDISPLMSKCEIKVLYIGENRNHSYISKETALEMSKTLRGAPIVGYYKEEKEDFADHGERITIDDEGIHFDCMTIPYGFVSPDAEVWFQKFEDYDDFGNSTEREYLMTTGYLWTGQFEECKLAIDEGRPHSMELDEKTLDGKWSTNSNSGLDFFIINDAIFSKLCILGDDVEPCFEGSSVTAPNISNSFSLDDKFKKTLFSMMEDLKNLTLKGGQQVENLENTVEKIVETSFENMDKEVEIESTENQNYTEEDSTVVEETLDAASEYVEKEEEKQEEETSDKEDEKESEEENEKKKETEEYKCDDSDEDKKKYELLESQYNELQSDYTALEEKYNKLVEFKNQVEDAKKDELISSFDMLSEEEMKDVVENKTSYSYEEIESKLSILYARQRKSEKKSEKQEDMVITTFSIENNDTGLPEWLKAVKETEKTMNN